MSHITSVSPKGHCWWAICGSSTRLPQWALRLQQFLPREAALEEQNDLGYEAKQVDVKGKLPVGKGRGLLQTALQHEVSSCHSSRRVPFLFSHPPRLLRVYIVLVLLVCLSTELLHLKRGCQRDICRHSRAGELSLVGTSISHSRGRQDSRQMRQWVTGDIIKGSRESPSYKSQCIFKKFGLLQQLQLGGALPSVRIASCNLLVMVVVPHKSPFCSPCLQLTDLEKALASLLRIIIIIIIFFLWNKKHLPTHHRLDLLVSQRPGKLLAQTFAGTRRWKELHLASSAACCLNSSTQFIHFSYK